MSASRSMSARTARATRHARRTRRDGAGRRREHGLSLIELMIALVLGLIVVAAVFNVYVGTSKSARFTSGLQTLQESGRFGVGVLQRGLRIAGFDPAASLAPLDIAASAADRVTVNAIEARDCNGGDTSAVGGRAVNTYAFDAATSTLNCAGNVGTTPVALVENVDAFRVLYGIDGDGDRVPDRFEAWNASIAPVDVVALRVALLVNSGTDIRRAARPETHVLLDEEFRTDDRRARHVFSSTVMLRNLR